MYLVSFSETYMDSLNCSSVFIGIGISFFYYGLFFNFAAILYLFSVNFLTEFCYFPSYICWWHLVVAFGLASWVLREVCLTFWRTFVYCYFGWHFRKYVRFESKFMPFTLSSLCVLTEWLIIVMALASCVIFLTIRVPDIPLAWWM